MTTAAPTQTRTFHGIELAAVGQWNAAQGDGNITAQDIAGMVAAYRNRQTDRIPIKLGHNDNRFQNQAGHPPQDQDGHPAYGWVENLRTSADGRTLLGDIVGVPAKLADILPSAFRRRSIEMTRTLGANGARTGQAQMTGLALLGVAAPAVKGLDDLLALYSAGTPVTAAFTALVNESAVDDARLVATFLPWAAGATRLAQTTTLTARPAWTSQQDWDDARATATFLRR